MNEKRLLITMGCSFTEGVGCWDMEITPETLRANDRNYHFYSNSEQNKKRFHEFGWPNRVGKKLGFDKVVNIGREGDGISAQLKRFTERILDNNQYKDYEITIVFLLPEPARFSFYFDNKIKSFGPYNSHMGIVREYLFNLKNSEGDPFLEQLFYLKLFREMCKSREYDYYLFNLYTDEFNEWIINHFNDERYSTRCIDFAHYDTDHLMNLICGHFNEDGYELVSENMCEFMLSKDKNIKKDNKNFEWEWLGDDYSWKEKLE